MVLPFLTGSRRGRVLGVAILLITLVLWLGYQTPLSTVRQDPFDLHTNPTPEASNAGKPTHDHTSSHHESPAQEVEEDEDTADPPSTSTSTSTAEDVITDIDELAVATTTTEVTATTEATPTSTARCLDFKTLQEQNPEPLSEGRRKFPYVRPPPECRKFGLPALEDLIERMKKVIRDPDLFRLFENSYPNTLDTMIKWRGYATKKDKTTGEETETDEELTYVITGDIDAMWLRDSASQIYSYLPLLEASEDKDSLASLWRGAINSHSRYIIISPYCHSFQPPPESGIKPSTNAAYPDYHTMPPFDPKLVFECKWELDSLASFLQISTAYYTRTGDLDFFGKYSWVDAVEAAVDASAAMRRGTYDEEGHVLPSAFTFTGWTNRGSETLTNDGLGNPVKENGMVRSAFRPSDDTCIFQLLTPSNMMWAAYLEQASEIMHGLAEGDVNPKAANLTVEMRKLAKGIRRGIALDAVVHHRDFGEIFAYEVDGYGGANLMDDANIPSLLAMPLWNYTFPAGKQMVKSVKHTARSDVTATETEEEEESEPSTAPRSRPSATETEYATEPSAAPRSGATTTATTTTETDEDSKTSTSTETGDEEKEHDYAKIYQNTRKFVLSTANPYFAKGPALSAVGGPHLGPGRGWPMAATVAALTAFDDLAGFASLKKRDEAVAEQLFAVLNSTAGTGVIHETVHAWNETQWTRAWFGWANGLFGQLVLRIAEDEEARGILGEEEGLLGRSWQD
jgi:meiotically up-regulated gene 157 (Mug157) protein